MLNKTYKFSIKKFGLYLIRWQLSTPILALCCSHLDAKYGVIGSTIIANLVGGMLFFWIDRWIFKYSGGRTPFQGYKNTTAAQEQANT